MIEIVTNVVTPFLPEWLIQYATYAEAMGLPAILSLICLLQYFLYLYYRYCVNDRELQFMSSLNHLEGKLGDLQRDRYLTLVENGILREIFATTATGKAVELLLKKFVPNSSQGFVVFFCVENNRLEVFLQRGLSPKTASQIRLDAQWYQQVLDRRVVRIPPAELSTSEFFACLLPRERKKLEDLHLFAVADHNEIFGIIATTHLFPVCVDLSFQQDVVCRILESVTGSLRQTLQLVDQQHLLKLTQEKLALRAIADRHHETPIKMIDDYLSRLLSLVEADRGSLLLPAQNSIQPFRVMSRQGINLQPSLEAVWAEHEQVLAAWAKNARNPCSLSSLELGELGIQSLMGSALVITLRRNKQLLAVLILARRDHGIFSSMQINLADWAAHFLAQTLTQVLDRVEVERMASMDGLTELANRRTFDIRIRQELQTAREQGGECTLGLFDLDHFKKINDTYGHQAGDEVLRQFARLLEQETRKVRATDYPLVARYGGEEMAVLMPGIGLQGATRISESIRAAVEQMQVLYQGHPISTSVSVGLACFPRHALTVESLIQAADNALYQAKREGRNTVRHIGLGTDTVLETAATSNTRH